MTRIEKVMSEYGKMHSKRKIMQYCPGNWILGAPKLIRENCPGDLLDWGEPVVDAKTAKFNNISYITGCRGITCPECWNQEATE